MELKGNIKKDARALGNGSHPLRGLRIITPITTLDFDEAHASVTEASECQGVCIPIFRATIIYPLSPRIYKRKNKISLRGLSPC